MSDETVDPKYKLMFNLGYVQSHFKNTSELTEKMIAKASPDDANAMREGKKEYQRGAYRRQADKMTRSADRDAEILRRYHAEMGPLPTVEQDEKLVQTALKRQAPNEQESLREVENSKTLYPNGPGHIPAPERPTAVHIPLTPEQQFEMATERIKADTNSRHQTPANPVSPPNDGPEKSESAAPEEKTKAQQIKEKAADILRIMRGKEGKEDERDKGRGR